MKEKKNSKLLVVLVIILSLLVVGLGGYLAYDKVIKMDNNDKSNAVDNKMLIAMGKELLDVYGYHDEFTEEMKMWLAIDESYRSKFSKGCDSLYSKTLTKDGSDSYVIKKGDTNTGAIYCSGDNNVLLYKYANDTYKRLFGGELPKKYFIYSEYSAYDFVKDEYDGELFVELEWQGSYDGLLSTFVSGVKNARLEENRFIVEVAGVTLKAETDDSMNMNFDNYVVETDKNIKYSKDKVENSYDEVINDLIKNHYDLMKKVKYVFEEKDGHYILTSIEK